MPEVVWMCFRPDWVTAVYTHRFRLEMHRSSPCPELERFHFGMLIVPARKKNVDMIQ